MRGEADTRGPVKSPLDFAGGLFLLAIAVLGFGGATLGDAQGAISEHQALAALEAGYVAGIDYFDTSPWYGNGKSELRFGAVLRGKPRASFILSTKVGRVYAKCTDPNHPSQVRWRGGLTFSPTFDYTRDGVLRSLEASLQLFVLLNPRLGVTLAYGSLCGTSS